MLNLHWFVEEARETNKYTCFHPSNYNNAIGFVNHDL